MTQNTQIQKNKHLASAKSLIQSEKFQKEVEKALPKHLSTERFLRIAITMLTRKPKLAECTPASLCKCLLDLSAIGLEPDDRHAHLIPYGKECTLVIDYKGLIVLIRRSGDVVSVRAETVCENDDFEWINGEITHRIDWRKPRGKVQAAYAEAKLRSGEVQTSTMTYDEIEAIRKRSKAANNGPWVTDWSEMAKKTPLRRLTKMLPLSAEVSEHLDKVDSPIDFENMKSAKSAESIFMEKPIDPFAEEDDKQEKSDSQKKSAAKSATVDTGNPYQPKEKINEDLNLEGGKE